MGLRKVSVRLPDDVLTAIDRADVNRSKFLRRVATEAVADGEIEVPEDLRKLAERELAVDEGKLPRKSSTFKKRCYDHFADAWRHGAITGSDARGMAESWLTEAALYGPDYVAFAETVVDWYERNYVVNDRPDFPSAETFVAKSDPDEVDPEPVVRTLRKQRERGFDPESFADSLRSEYPDEVVDEALEVVGDD